jgi:polyisoprenoid-binding protein YceI
MFRIRVAVFAPRIQARLCLRHQGHARIQFRIKHIGKGRGPWGKFRRGFEDPLEITLTDYGITEYLGKDERSLELIINLEGTR